MKKILSLLIAAAASLSLTAQTSATTAKTPSADALFSDAISKVVLDFTHNFLNIQGNKLPAEADADTYRSKACPPAAIGCRVMRYRSVQDKSASWQAAMYTGESFDEALKAYKKLFGQVKKTTVKGIEGGTFEGTLETVDENVGFASSTLRLKTKDRHYKDMVAEVAITSTYTNWEVSINIYTKKQIAEEEE